MSSALSRHESGPRLLSSSRSGLVHLDQFVNEIVERILVGGLSRLILVKVLVKYLLQVFMQFFRSLVFRKMFFIVLD